MMEFTVSRVCISICGLILLAAVVVPVTGMYESQAAGREDEIAKNAALLIDGCYYSEMNEFTLTMNDILPNAASHIRMNGNIITVTTERGTYNSVTDIFMTGDGGPFGYGDIIRICRGDGCLIIELLR